MQKPNNVDLTYYQSVMNLRKGNYIVLNNKPCKIVSIKDQMSIKAVDILNGSEIERTFIKEDDINVPHFNIYEYDVIGQKSLDTIILKHYDQIEEFILPSQTDDQKRLSKLIINNLSNNQKQKICVFESMGYKQIFDYKLIK